MELIRDALLYYSGSWNVLSRQREEERKQTNKHKTYFASQLLQSCIIVEIPRIRTNNVCFCFCFCIGAKWLTRHFCWKVKLKNKCVDCRLQSFERSINRNQFLSIRFSFSRIINQNDNICISLTFRRCESLDRWGNQINDQTLD